MDRNPSPPSSEAEEEGDAVGNTVYSKHWLFSILTRLIEVISPEKTEPTVSPEGIQTELDEEMENDICKVWDMSMDEDVALFLQEFNAPDIFMGVFAKSKCPRLTAQLHSQILYLLPLSGAGGWGMGVAVSSSHVVSAAPSSSHSSPAPGWGPSHGRQSFMNFSNVGPFHGLQFFKVCSSEGPFHGVQSFRNGLLQRGSPAGSQVLSANLLQHGLLSMGPQVLPAACSSTGSSPRGHSLLWASTCSGVGSPMGCRWISAPPLTSMGSRGTACLTMVFTMGCRGISVPAPGAPPPPPSSPWCPR